MRTDSINPTKPASAASSNSSNETTVVGSPDQTYTVVKPPLGNVHYSALLVEQAIDPAPSIVGNDSRIKEIKRLITQIAPTSSTVLITGETGVGKELVAREIHLNSKRKDKPFIAINCAALPVDTIESVLFGHEKGAFTDASKTTVGLFEAAKGGTLFLDEIGEISTHLQAKLERVLEYQTFERVGGNDLVHTDARIIVATNRNLDEALAKKKFRRGFYDRVNIFPIYLPPLRDRKEDIGLIAEHLFLKHAFFSPGEYVVNELTDSALEKLLNHNWKGNVRELENVILRAIVLASGLKVEEGDIILNTKEASRKVEELIDRGASSNAPVLITGETGSGKELKAKEIHEKSFRKEGPFVVVNCAAINKHLAESLLFGHTKGTFTGAYKPHKGYFEAASGGTLFLDEVGELDLNIQGKLLRAIQEQEILVMGTTNPQKVNVRILAATNKNLEEAVKKGEFREDLYYRLNVLPIEVLPLRERRAKIPILAYEFLEQVKEGKDIRGISEEAMAKLMDYDWPGNIRQLKTTIQRAVIFAKEGSELQACDIDLGAKAEKAIPLTNTLNDVLSSNELHPTLNKYLRELTDYVKSSVTLEQDRVSFLVIQCRVAKLIIGSKVERVTDEKIIRELDMCNRTLRNLLKKFGYTTQALVKEIFNEIYRNN